MGKQVARAVASILDEGIASAASNNTDLRPKLIDQISGRSILIDSGASLSIWPVADYPGKSPDPFRALKAVNDSTIQTFGVQKIEIQASSDFKFEHEFILASIDEVIVGWDYLTLCMPGWTFLGVANSVF